MRFYDYSKYHQWFFTAYERLQAYFAETPKRVRTLGRKLCGHDSTTPPLDFRPNRWASQFNRTEVQNGSREFNAENSSRLDERVR